jgi:hypothetical protein
MIRLVYKIVTNQLDSGGHCAKALSATKLVLIAKKPSGVRPIAVGETLRRIAGGFIVKWCKNSIIAELGPHQFAMRSNGTNALAFAARNTRLGHPDWVMICPDAKNAFNSQNRRSGITQMCAMLPQITPYAKMCYGEDADIFLANPVDIQQLNPCDE